MVTVVPLLALVPLLTITVNTRYAETRYGLLNRILSAINGNPFINASYIAELVGSTQIKIQALSSGNQSSSSITVSENIDVSVVATGNIGSQGRKLIGKPGKTRNNCESPRAAWTSRNQ